MDSNYSSTLIFNENDNCSDASNLTDPCITISNTEKIEDDNNIHLLNTINLNYQSKQLFPSYLTQDERNFLNFETNNAFLFITTIESSIFRIIYVTDSIYRILNLTSDQSINQEFFSFIHPDDLSEVQNQLIQQIDNRPSIECRLKRNNDSYLLMDWKIFLVDYSISTFPLLSFDLFHNKSILDFIYIDDQMYVHQTLLNSILTLQDELIICSFMYPSIEILTMILHIEPIINPSNQKINFIELIFKNLTDVYRQFKLNKAT